MKPKITKEYVETTAKLVEKLYMAISPNRRTGYLGALNEIFLFIDEVKATAPD